MMDKAKNYQVRIFDDSYSLLSDESENHVAQSAALVDSLMKEIADKSSISDQKKIAILAALRMASKLLHIEKNIEQRDFEEEKLIDAINLVLAPDSTVSAQ